MIILREQLRLFYLSTLNRKNVYEMFICNLYVCWTVYLSNNHVLRVYLAVIRKCTNTTKQDGYQGTLFTFCIFEKKIILYLVFSTTLNNACGNIEYVIWSHSNFKQRKIEILWNLLTQLSGVFTGDGNMGRNE